MSRQRLDRYGIRPRGGLRSAGILLVGTGLVLLTAVTSPAAAQDYRYWTLWTGTPEGAWQAAMTGAADIAMTDTAVVGWHFTIAPADGGTRPPAFSADFTSLCPEFTSPIDGQHRVAVVVDTGAPDVAPPGEQPPPPRVGCVSVDVGQSALDATVLAVADLRADGGLVCGLDGYPAVECGTSVDADTANGADGDLNAADPGSADAADSPSRTVSPWPWVIGAVVIATSVLLLVLALAQRARRRQ